MTKPSDWGVPVFEARGPGALVAYLAGSGGAPRVQMWDGPTKTADFFAFESSFRGGVTGAWGADARLYLMAGGYGGPRMRVFEPSGRQVADSFVADPDARGSWVPVPVRVDVTVEKIVEKVVEKPVPGPTVYVDRPVPTPTPTPTLPPVLNLGQVTNPGHFLIYLQFEIPADATVPLSADEMRAAVLAYWDFVKVLGNVAVTTVRPNCYPAGYGRILYGPRLDFTRDTSPPSGVAGIAPVSWTYRPDRWDDKPAWIDHHRTGTTAIARAMMMRHESWHGLGLSESQLAFGEDYPLNIKTARAGATTAASVSARWRAAK